MALNRRQAKALGRVAAGAGAALNKAADKVSELEARRLEEARNGDSELVRQQLENGAKLRRQADKFLTDATEAENAGKASKAARLRKAAERPMRQAEEWERKAAAEGDRLRAWAAAQDAGE